MKEHLRSPEQGADTVVWLAMSEAAVTNPSGRLFQGLNNTLTYCINVYVQQLK